MCRYMRENYERTEESVRLAAERLATLKPVMQTVCREWSAWKIDEVRLFGSTAREECNPGSDIDLLVIIPDDQWDRTISASGTAFVEAIRERLGLIHAEASFTFVRRSRYEKPEDYRYLSDKMLGALHDAQEHGVVVYHA